jgi:hypothetical protein
MQVRQHAFHEGRAGRERQQLRQEVPQCTRDLDRAVRAVDPDVHVKAKGVVPPDDVAKELVVAAVMRRVDDALVLPAAPRMRPGRRETDAESVGERAQLCAP